MNQKKNNKILIVIVLVLILIIGGVAITFFATDVFKSDKELFFKYASKIVDSNEGFIENDLTQYFEKRKTTPYNDEGSFSANITAEENQEQLKNVNNFNITFSGNVDTANSKSYQEISLNYSNDVNFPVNYKQIENKIGLQTKYVGKNFVAVETDKLNNLSENSISTDTEVLETVQEINKIELTDEEKNHIQTTYKEVLNKQLGKEKFSKIKESDQTGYKLSLTGEDIKNILVQILETLKNDELTLNKLNEYLETLGDNSEKLSTRDIDDTIKSLNNNSDINNNEKIDISIFNKKGKTSKISISTNEFKIDIQKENSQDNLKYSIALETFEEDSKINLSASYTGLSTMQNINEAYEIGLESEGNQFKYQFNNNVTFTDSVNIEEFTDQNSILLTNYEPEQVTNFLGAVGERIEQVNKQQMEQLGIKENENPIIYMIPSLLITQSNSMLDSSAEELNNTEINTFNEQFEMYASTNQRGVTVKGLLSMISSNNETSNKNRQISEINFNGEEYEATQENIAFIKGDIDTSKNYRVEFEKDSSTGAIYRAVINEK